MANLKVLDMVSIPLAWGQWATEITYELSNAISKGLDGLEIRLAKSAIEHKYFADIRNAVQKMTDGKYDFNERKEEDGRVVWSITIISLPDPPEEFKVYSAPQEKKVRVEYCAYFSPVGAWVCNLEKEKFEIRCPRCKELLCNETTTTELVYNDGYLDASYCEKCYKQDEIEQMIDEAEADDGTD